MYIPVTSFNELDTASFTSAAVIAGGKKLLLARGEAVVSASGSDAATAAENPRRAAAMTCEPRAGTQFLDLVLFLWAFGSQCEEQLMVSKKVFWCCREQ